MKFHYIAPQSANGTILAHSTRVDGQRIKKGSVLNNQTIQLLMAAGFDCVMVAQLEQDDIEENDAARILSDGFLNSSIVTSTPVAGRVNLIADCAGVLTIVEADIDAFNGVDESITLATLAPLTVAHKGDVVGTIKIIPFSAQSRHVKTIQDRCSCAQALAVVPVSKQKIALIQTYLKDTKPSLLQKSGRVTAERLVKFDKEINLHLECDHSPEALAATLENAMQFGCDLVMIIGVSAIMDRRDIIPQGIEMVGGQVDHLGVPTEPGNLMLIGRIKSCVVLGLPGCARSPALNGLDLILPQIMANLPIDSKAISALGVGGLLKTVRDKQGALSKPSSKMTNCYE